MRVCFWICDSSSTACCIRRQLKKETLSVVGCIFCYAAPLVVNLDTLQVAGCSSLDMHWSTLSRIFFWKCLKGVQEEVSTEVWSSALYAYTMCFVKGIVFAKTLATRIWNSCEEKRTGHNMRIKQCFYKILWISWVGWCWYGKLWLSSRRGVGCVI